MTDLQHFHDGLHVKTDPDTEYWIDFGQEPGHVDPLPAIEEPAMGEQVYLGMGMWPLALVGVVAVVCAFGLVVVS